MEKIKKSLAFFALCACVVGIIGGFGYCVYIQQLFIALCIVVVGAASAPQIKKLFNYLRG